MNRISVARNTLIIAVLVAAGAFIMAGCGKNQPAGASDTAEKKIHGSIAFVELDSVIANFDMAEDKALYSR